MLLDSQLIALSQEASKEAVRILSFLRPSLKRLDAIRDFAEPSGARPGPFHNIYIGESGVQLLAFATLSRNQKTLFDEFLLSINKGDQDTQKRLIESLSAGNKKLNTIRGSLDSISLRNYYQGFKQDITDFTEEFLNDALWTNRLDDAQSLKPLPSVQMLLKKNQATGRYMFQSIIAERINEIDTFLEELTQTFSRDSDYAQYSHQKNERNEAINTLRDKSRQFIADLTRIETRVSSDREDIESDDAQDYLKRLAEMSEELTWYQEHSILLTYDFEFSQALDLQLKKYLDDPQILQKKLDALRSALRRNSLDRIMTEFWTTSVEKIKKLKIPYWDSEIKHLIKKETHKNVLEQTLEHHFESNATPKDTTLPPHLINLI